MDGWMDWRMEGGIDGRMDWLMDGCMNEGMDGCMDGWVEIEGRKGGWMDELIRC